jgi:hypothetical protein
MMEYGDEKAVVDYLCKIAYLRAKAILGKEINR